TLPSNPTLGDKVQVQDFAHGFETNYCTIDAGTELIDDTETTLILTTVDTVITLTYDIYEDGTYGWTTVYGRDNKDNIGHGGTIITGDVTSEDGIYESMLMHSSFSECHYDIFRINSQVIPSGSPSPIYRNNDSLWEGSSGSILTTNELIAYDGTSTIFRFYPHIEADDSAAISGEYSTDGTNWNSMDFDEIHHVTNGFDSLLFRFTWGGTGDFNSFGTLYLNNDYVTNTTTRMFELNPVDGTHSPPYLVTLPNNAYYVIDGKSLEVYRNGIRQIIGLHYEEVDENTIRFLVDITDGDIIMFTEFFGYVDLSSENFDRVNKILGLEEPILSVATSESIIDQGSGQKIQTKIIDIGDWDMVATITKSVAHGVTFANIRHVGVLIRNDDDISLYMFERGQDLYTTIDSTYANLTRRVGSMFDDVAFDSTSYNRGWITIGYIE
ncbi:MAG: hypothetical protein KAS32_04685, partial [Candidatus Peribacteraceae bacterium]|nr:hypothetical protein [Candidatus Peribacteraceae bacterium]